MNIWMLFAAIAAGWMVQLWLTSRQAQAYLRATRVLRTHGTVATGQAGRRYRGGVVFVSLATDGRRVTAAQGLRGLTTFARPTPLPALVGLRLAVVAGDRPLEGLTDNERDAARQAAGMLRAAVPRTADAPAATSSPRDADVRIPTGAGPVA